MKLKKDFLSKRSEGQALVLARRRWREKERYVLGPPLFRCTRALRRVAIFEAEDRCVFRPPSYNTQQRRIMRFRMQ